MARIEASITAISNFKNNVITFQNTASDTASSAFNLYDELTNYTFSLIKTTEDGLAKADKVLKFGDKKQKSLEQELKSLESQLRSTPPTVTETTTDSNGNTHSYQVPNPAYQALQRAIAKAQNRLNRLENTIRRAETLTRQIEQERMTLNTCLKEFQEHIKSASSNFKDVSASTSTAVEKLDKLINVISNYHAVKIGGGWLD